MKDYSIVTLSCGSCIDRDAGSGRIYEIKTWTLRLDPAGLNDFHRSRPIDETYWECEFETRDAFIEERERREKMREEWERDVIKAAGLEPSDRYTIKQIVSEFFAVAHICEV